MRSKSASLRLAEAISTIGSASLVGLGDMTDAVRLSGADNTKRVSARFGAPAPWADGHGAPHATLVSSQPTPDNGVRLHAIDVSPRYCLRLFVDRGGPPGPGGSTCRHQT